MRYDAAEWLVSPARSLAAVVAFVLLVISPLWIGALVVGSVSVALAANPAQVTLDGEWVLDRSVHPPCVVAVPPVLDGSIHIEADFEAGTVSGRFEGSGAGSYTVPAECKTEDPNEYDRTHLEQWTAELSVIEGTFSGALDPETGVFDVAAIVYIEGGGEYAAPGSQYLCHSDSLTPTCIFPELIDEQEARVAGKIEATGTSIGIVDWHTAYCPLISSESIVWSPPQCATIGEWTADTTHVVWKENAAPRVSAISASPPDPTTDDTVVLSVDATDPDGDELTYAWFVNAVPEGPSSPSVTWAEPSAGNHEIKVTVSDGIDTADAFMDIQVSEHVGADDRDGDGVPDDEDLCPSEWGEGDDGCPPFSATIACVPASPVPDDTVVCSATVGGRHVGETLSFHWYLDGGSVLSGESATWTWGSAESGPHDIGVQAIGEGRSSEADLTLEVGGGVVDEATAGFHIVSLGCNSDVSSDDTLECAMTFERDRDDIGPLLVLWLVEWVPSAPALVAGNSANQTFAQPPPGDHAVFVTLTDPATNYSIIDRTSGNVTPGKNAMIPAALQAGAAVATTLTAAGWLALERARRNREDSAVSPEPITDDDRYWDERNRLERAAALRAHQRFADQQWAEFTERSRIRAAADRATADADRRDRRLRMMKADRIEEIALREGHGDITDYLDRQLEEGTLPSWNQLRTMRDAVVRRAGDQAAMDRYYEKGDVGVFLEGVHDTLAWGTGKVAGAMTGEVGGRIAEWLVRNPDVPIRVGLAAMTVGKSELVLLPIDAWRSMDAAADRKMAEQNFELTAWEATWEVIKTGAWHVGGEVAGDAVSRWWSGGGAAAREATEEVTEVAVTRAGAQTSDDFVRRVNTRLAAKQAAREAGEEIPDAAARRALEADEFAGHVSRTRDDYLRTFARDGEVIPLNHLHETGYTSRDIAAASRISAEEGVEIYARTTNIDSMRHIRNGTALPKPLDIKAKTINDLDTWLGAKPQDKGLVGYFEFEPTKPDLSNVPGELRSSVEKRFTERLDEFTRLSKDTKFQSLIDNKVLRIEDGKIIDIATGKPFAGDIDAVFIKDHATKKYLTDGPRYERVMERWRAEVGGQHGVEMNVVEDITAPYRPGTPQHEEAFAKAMELKHKLQASHTSGKEIVVRFDGDGVLRRGPRDIDLTPSADQILTEGAEKAVTTGFTDTGGSIGSIAGRELEGRPDAP